jgi:hypothetical protein
MKNETHKLPVEWVIEQLQVLELKKDSMTAYVYESRKSYIIHQAKEMEKKQIEDAELRSKEIIIIKHTEHEGGNK